MTLGQGHDTPLAHGQQLCEISRSNMAVRSYGPDTDFGYVCTVTLTLEVRPWVNVMTHPWVMDNNCVKYYHTGIFKGCGYSSRLWLQFLKDVATVKNGRFAREFSGKSTTNAHFTEIMLPMPI